jgi:hypothetical protein
MTQHTLSIGSSCNSVRPFDYETIQRSLASLLYSDTAVSADLRCSDQTGNSISCPDGFCRSISDGNGLVTYSSCVKNSLVATPFGITVSRSTMNDLGGDQSSIIFTCNKPSCNSKESTEHVHQLLFKAGIIPQATITTSTTPRNGGEQLAVSALLALFPMFTRLLF